MGISKGSLGASAVVSESPSRKKGKAAARRRQEKRWQRKCNPVSVRFVEPGDSSPWPDKDA